MAACVRGPLSPTTNNSNSPPPSPPSSISKAATTDAKVEMRAAPSVKAPTLRRKATVQNLVNLDSSESIPSPHSSLYNASVEFTHTSENQPEDEAWIYDKDDTKLPAWANTVCDNNGDPVPISFLQPIIHPKMHTPHRLYPITEQSSLATLHPSLRSVSTDNHPSTLTLRSRRSRSPGLNGLRQKSFSLSDLPHTQNANELPSDEAFPNATIRHVPFPNRPVHPSPVRSPTPPNLPRFGKYSNLRLKRGLYCQFCSSLLTQVACQEHQKPLAIVFPHPPEERRSGPTSLH